MHGRVALVTDSTAGIPAELATRWGIGVVPLRIQIGDKLETAAQSGVPVHVIDSRTTISPA